MNATAASSFQGVAQIVRFNWPMYVAGALGLGVAMVGAALVPPALAVFLVVGVGLCGLWLLGSLVASHWIYDRSPLRRWRWIEPALGFVPRRWLNLHAGLDESTPALRRLFPNSCGQVFDFYDEREMNEPSIRRARRLATSAIAPEPVNFRRLPLGDGSCDAAMLLLSAHELRSHESRRALLRELHRVLDDGGRIVLAEHLRDLANFIAFGPGFLHFHSRRAWLQAVRESGLEVEKRFRITPFITVLVLRRSS